MKKVRFICDACGEPAPKGALGRQRVRCLMYTDGYGMRDGEHTLRAHICSAECGLRLLKKYVREIEGAA